MPVNILKNEGSVLLMLEGVITAEDTDEVAGCLKENPAALVDLAKCEHLHTAALQAILVLRPCIAAMPADPFWGGCISIQMEEKSNEDDFISG